MKTLRRKLSVALRDLASATPRVAIKQGTIASCKLTTLSHAQVLALRAMAKQFKACEGLNSQLQDWLRSVESLLRGPDSIVSTPDLPESFTTTSSPRNRDRSVSPPPYQG